MTVVSWKPLPDDGISLYERERWLYEAPDTAYVRPPEPVYEAAGINARLSPVPHELLAAMAGSALLRERAFRWTEWSLQRPGSVPARIGERGVNAMRKVAFIARDGVLPLGRLPRWHELDWIITGGGFACLEANVRPARDFCLTLGSTCAVYVHASKICAPHYCVWIGTPTRRLGTPTRQTILRPIRSFLSDLRRS